MKKNISKIICCVLILSTVFMFSACSASNKEETTQSTASSKTQQSSVSNSAENTQEETTQNTTEKTTAEKTSKKTTTTEFSGEMSISVNQALDALENFYGKDYDINATVNEDGFQYFAVFDKKGNKYASVKVNLETADATETIVSTGESNDYNLLA